MSATTLKLIALVCMTLDHFSSVLGAPVCLRYVGRFAAVIFFFCAAESAAHTSDRGRYLRRLYIASVAMPLLNGFVAFVINGWIPNIQVQTIRNNIFAVIFHGVWLIDICTDARRRTRLRNYALWQIGAFVLLFLAGRLFMLVPPAEPYLLASFAAATGSVFLLEGGYLIMLLIPLFYWCRGSRKRLAVCFTAYSLAICSILVFQLPTRFAIHFAGPVEGYMLMQSIGSLFGWPVNQHLVSLRDSLLRYHFQWMMIFALPLLLCYNGKRGKGHKRLFYIYYPAHLYLLHLISAFIIKFK